MDRRGFLQSLLGLAASTALPEKAVAFLAQTSVLPDAVFTEYATNIFGTIKNVRFYNRALSAEEISQLTA